MLITGSSPLQIRWIPKNHSKKPCILSSQFCFLRPSFILLLLNNNQAKWREKTLRKPRLLGLKKQIFKKIKPFYLRKKKFLCIWSRKWWQRERYKALVIKSWGLQEGGQMVGWEWSAKLHVCGRQIAAGVGKASNRETACPVTSDGEQHKESNSEAVRGNLTKHLVCALWFFPWSYVIHAPPAPMPGTHLGSLVLFHDQCELGQGQWNPCIALAFNPMDFVHDSPKVSSHTVQQLPLLRRHHLGSRWVEYGLQEHPAPTSPMRAEHQWQGHGEGGQWGIFRGKQGKCWHPDTIH